MRRRAGVGMALLAILLATGSTTSAFAASVPYRDPAAQGYLGICDQAGHQITSGSTATVPFAWRVVSSEPALTPYNNVYRTAILLAYQPINGLAPGSWSGEGLTASSRYSNPFHPMAAATLGDMSLASFVRDFPPHWNGLVELRLYLGTADKPTYSYRYPTLDIQVTGSTWHALDGGNVNCAAGTATSLETIVLPSSTTTSPSSTTSTTVATAISNPTGSSFPLWWWVAPGVVVIVAAAVALRRSRINSQPSENSTESERH